MNLYTFIKHFHSGWAFIVILSSALLLFFSLYYFFTKRTVGKGLKKVSFYTVLSFHIQFLVGIGLYLCSPIVKNAWASGADVMKVAINRFYAVEHPFMMFTAVILMTIANAKLKKSPKIKISTLVFIILAMVCFYMIPWSIWMHSM